MIKVSIIDDLVHVRDSFSIKINQQTDMKCLSAYSNAEDALAEIPLRKPDIALMDIDLPGMNGIECMMRIKEALPNTRFLMFTVFENDDNVFEALKAGADGYVLKRETSTKVIECIRELYSGGAPMSRKIAQKVLFSFREQKEKKRLIEDLTPREMDIIHLIARGLPNKLIAIQLNIAEGTVKQHIHNIYKKLQVCNRTEAVKKYMGY